jgi:L-ascorbate metabolism protein UlaG (beta-lactamase superfamily)
MPVADTPAIEITYIGGPTAVIEIAGITFITDPTFDAPGKDYRSGSVTLRKLAGPAIDADRLGHIDVALVSHEQHPDNLDESGRALASSVPLALTTRPSAAKLGRNAVGLSPWERREIPAPSGVTLTVTATPARHGPAGIERIAGEVVGFVIGVAETNEDLVYVTGDTVWYSGTAEVARRYSPRVVLLFAGAARTRGPFHLTMDTNDAVELASAFEHAAIVPVHHEGWAHFTQSQDDIAATFATLGIEGRLRRVAPGDSVRF